MTTAELQYPKQVVIVLIAGIKIETHFATDTSKPSPEMSPIPPQQHSYWKQTFWVSIGIGLLVFAIVALMVIGLLNSDALETVENQMQALHENQVTEAYYDYTSKEFKEATSLEAFKEFIKFISIFIESEVN